MNRVLVVDDEDDVRQLIHDVLTGSGYEVFTASSGEEALTKSVSLTPDLIVLDVVMQRLSGLEVCRLLKAKPSMRGVKVLVLTALGRDVDRQMITEAGADDYLRKPFSVDELLSKVDTLLSDGKDTKPLRVK